MKRARLFALSLSMLLATSLPAAANIISYQVVLSGLQSVPNNTSTASGSAIVTVNDVLDTVFVNLSFSGLTGGVATAAHIHCCVATNANGPVVIPFTNFPSATTGTYSNLFTGISASVIAGIEAGQAYINIHNRGFPGGEIRGDILPAAVIPEPTAVALLGLGLFGLLVNRSMRRQRRAGPATMPGLMRVIAIGLGTILALPASAAVLYRNLNPNGLMAMATQAPATNVPEVEAADDFVLASHSSIQSATFIGLLAPNSGASSIAQVVVEIYRVFPLDSNVGRTSGPPTFSTSRVPTRVNSPSDVELADRSTNSSNLAFTATRLNSTFTAANSISPTGIHPLPGQNTGGNGAVTGQEFQLDVTFTTPFDLPADHYFFVPQVTMNDGTTFYWLSAARPPDTPFAPDLQAWIRDDPLAPDWLRVGTDIVGSGTFNAAFELNGVALVVPEPPTFWLVALALVLFEGRRRKLATRARPN